MRFLFSLAQCLEGVGLLIALVAGIFLLVESGWVVNWLRARLPRRRRREPVLPPEKAEQLERQRQAFVARQQQEVDAKSKQRQAEDEGRRHEEQELRRRQRLAYLDAKARSYGMEHVMRGRSTGAPAGTADASTVVERKQAELHESARQHQVQQQASTQQQSEQAQQEAQQAQRERLAQLDAKARSYGMQHLTRGHVVGQTRQPPGGRAGHATAASRPTDQSAAASGSSEQGAGSSQDPGPPKPTAWQQGVLLPGAAGELQARPVVVPQPLEGGSVVPTWYAECLPGASPADLRVARVPFVELMQPDAPLVIVYDGANADPGNRNQYATNLTANLSMGFGRRICGDAVAFFTSPGRDLSAAYVAALGVHLQDQLLSLYVQGLTAEEINDAIIKAARAFNWDEQEERAAG